MKIPFITLIKWSGSTPHQIGRPRLKEEKTIPFPLFLRTASVPEPPIHLARLLLELGLATPPPFHFFSFTKGETILLHLTTCIIFFVRFCTISRFGHGTTVRSVQTLFTRRTAADRHTRITCSQDSNCDTKFFDFIVVGSGVAGLRYALEVSKYGSVAIITKSEPQASNTNYAQGGVSVVLCPSDSVESHMQDTTIARAYLCDEETVKVSFLGVSNFTILFLIHAYWYPVAFSLLMKYDPHMLIVYIVMVF